MYSIGALSKATGVKVPTIRYYEEIGLIDHATRNAGNQRRYAQALLLRRHSWKRSAHGFHASSSLRLNWKGSPTCVKAVAAGRARCWERWAITACASAITIDRIQPPLDTGRICWGDEFLHVLGIENRLKTAAIVWI